MIKTSIIIVVKNDPGILNTLVALESELNDKTIEIIVVDASNGDLDNIRKQFKKVRWIRYINKKDKATIPEQRNVGVKAANGSIVIFIDANCIPTPSWYVNLTKPLAEGEQIAAGAVQPLNKKTVNNINNQSESAGKYLKECPTINIAVKKTIFSCIGFFDEQLQYGSDIDFSWRAIDQGVKIYNAKTAIVYHDWGDFKDEVRRSFKYGVAKSILLKKHKKRAANLGKYESVTLVYPAYIALLPLTLIIPYYPLVILVPIVRNLHNKPFKLVFINLLYGLGFLTGILFTKYKSH